MACGRAVSGEILPRLLGRAERTVAQRLRERSGRAVERHDVSEELQRLRSHAAAARELLGGDGAPAGKRLDFLAQELMREAKQLGAPYELLRGVSGTGRLPVPNFAAGGIATPADAALMMSLGAESVFVGSGIFMNPSVVARQVHTPFLILAAWAVGGAIALAGAFVYAELAALRPAVGGQYAYLREAFGPLVAFLYGWGLLLVIQSGGMAAVAVTFAHYANELVAIPIGPAGMATAVLLALTIVNCLGVRAGATVQSVLMVIKIAAIVGLVLTGVFFAPAVPAAPPRLGSGAQRKPRRERPKAIT